MGERAPGLGWVALAGGLGLCCGLPLLGTLGLLGFVAGPSSASWTLIGLGAAAVVLGAWQALRTQDHPPASRPVGEPTASTTKTDEARTGARIVREEKTS